MRWLGLLAVLLAVIGCAAGASGPVLRVSASELGKEGEVLRAQLARFEALHPGVRVEPYPTPDDSDLRHQLYVQWFNAGIAEPDVLQLDVIWTAELAAAGWILPLEGRGIDAGAFAPAAMAASQWRGAIYALPWFVDVGMVYYRTDLVRSPPRTIEELYAVAARVQRRHRLDAGFLWQGARYEGLVTVYLEHLTAFGGAILGPDGRAAVDEAAGVQALETMIRGIRSGVVPPAALGYHEEEVRLAFQAGRAAFMRNWPYCRVLLDDPRISSVAGKFAVMPMPPSRRPGGRPAATLGGAVLAINARSRHPDLAYELIAYLTAPAQMRERAEVTNQFPARLALYDDPSLSRALGLPVADVARLVKAAVPRPVTPVYRQLSSDLQIELHRALTGQVPAAEALRAAAGQIDAVLALARIDVLEGRAPPPPSASPLPLLAGLAMLAVIAAAAAVLRRRRAGAAARGAGATEVRLAWALVGPTLACIAFVAVFPLAWTAWESLHAHDLRLPWTGEPYVGLHNYREALGDDRFWGALAHTAMFTAISVALELVLGLVLAMLLDRAFRGRGLVRTTALVPWAIPTVVAALVWSFMFRPAGIADQALAWVGAADSSTAWFIRAATAWVPVILADVWKTTPFVALLLLAGLQGIDRTLYEAAAVDGASWWQQRWHVTLPMLRPTIAIALMFRVLDSFRVFDLIYVLTGGGPGTATEPLAMYTFTTILQELRFGYGAALSMLIFGGAFGLAVLFVRGLGADVMRGRS